jgi:hypothetical protein
MPKNSPRPICPKCGNPFQRGFVLIFELVRFEVAGLLVHDVLGEVEHITARRSGRDGSPISSATYFAFPAAAASAPWKFRPRMQSDCTAAMQSGRTSRSGYSIILAENTTKKMGAGRHLRRRSFGLPIQSLARIFGWPQSITLLLC